MNAAPISQSTSGTVPGSGWKKHLLGVAWCSLVAAVIASVAQLLFNLGALQVSAAVTRRLFELGLYRLLQVVHLFFLPAAWMGDALREHAWCAWVFSALVWGCVLHFTARGVVGLVKQKTA